MQNQQNASPSRIPSLDGLRALSILWVLMFHFLLTRMPGFDRNRTPELLLIFNGKLGVKLFLVISAFIITRALLGELHRFGRISLAQFYLKRAIKLVPLLLLYVLSINLIRWLRHEPLPDTYCSVLSMSFAIGFSPYCEARWDLAHLWSLTLEEMYYLIWAGALAGAALSRCRRWVWVGIALGAGCRLFNFFYLKQPGIAPDTSPPIPLLNYADFLVLGSALALHLPRIQAWRRWSPLWSGVLFSVAVVFFFGVQWVRHFGRLGPLLIPFGATIEAVAASVMLACGLCCRRGPLFSFLNWKPLATVGLASYSIYIWQQIFFSPQALFAVGSATEAFLSTVGGSIAVGIAAYYWLELPTTAWLRAKFVRTSTAVAPSLEEVSSELPTFLPHRPRAYRIKGDSTA